MSFGIFSYCQAPAIYGELQFTKSPIFNNGREYVVEGRKKDMSTLNSVLVKVIS